MHLYLICNKFKYAIFKFKPKISLINYTIFKSKPKYYISICKLKIFTGTHTALKMRKFSEPIFRSFLWHRLQILSCSKAGRGKRIFFGQFKISPLLLNIGWQGLFENYFNILVSLNRQQRGTFTNSSQPIWIHRQLYKYMCHLAHYNIAKTNQHQQIVVVWCAFSSQYWKEFSL